MMIRVHKIFLIIMYSYITYLYYQIIEFFFFYPQATTNNTEDYFSVFFSKVIDLFHFP